jgi:hypothetical protein
MPESISEPVCFENCGCSCDSTDKAFDTVIAKELIQPFRIQDICRSNISWYCDKSLTEGHFEQWDLGNRSGLYFLWHKDDYCAVHERFHMRALYVGKGAFSKRMRRHWAGQPTEDEMLVYFTYVDLPNRIAKYAEQLLLDCYDFPLNKAENSGSLKLCAYFTQSEVD